MLLVPLGFVPSFSTVDATPTCLPAAISGPPESPFHAAPFTPVLRIALPPKASVDEPDTRTVAFFSAARGVSFPQGMAGRIGQDGK
jgi:hypothetical protein